LRILHLNYWTVLEQNTGAIAILRRRLGDKLIGQPKTSVTFVRTQVGAGLFA
jgi:hypothetical protein